MISIERLTSALSNNIEFILAAASKESSATYLSFVNGFDNDVQNFSMLL